MSMEVGELKGEYSELEVGEGVSSQLSSDKSISLRFGNGKFSSRDISILEQETLRLGWMQSSFLLNRVDGASSLPRALQSKGTASTPSIECRPTKHTETRGVHKKMLVLPLGFHARLLKL